MELSKITTLRQVKFWLQKGEVVVIKLADSEAYLEKEKNKLLFTIQPKFGNCKVYENSWKAIDNLFSKLKDMKIQMFVVQGAYLIEKKSSLFDKIADYFRNNKTN